MRVNKLRRHMRPRNRRGILRSDLVMGVGALLVGTL